MGRLQDSILTSLTRLAVLDVVYLEDPLYRFRTILKQAPNRE